MGERGAHVLLDHRDRDAEALGDLAVGGVPETVQDEDLPAGRVQLRDRLADDRELLLPFQYLIRRCGASLGTSSAALASPPLDMSPWRRRCRFVSRARLMAVRNR